MPALIVGRGSRWVVEDFIVDQSTARYELLARGLAAAYEQFVMTHRQAVAALAAQAADVEPFTGSQLKRLLEPVKDAHPAVWRIGIVDASGRLLAVEPPVTPDGRSLLGLDLSDQPWFRRLSSTHELVMGRPVAAGDGLTTPTITLNAPIVDARGRLRGAVTAALDLAYVQALADDVRVGQTGYAQVATADGIALAHKNWDYVREQKDFSKLPIWRMVSTAESGRIRHYAGTLGDERLAGFATVPGVGWKVWVNQARSEVAQEIAALYGRIRLLR